MKNSKLLLLASLFFILNFAWEFLYYPLYYNLSGIPKYPRLALASFADIFLIVIIILIISLKNRNFEWIRKPSKSDYVYIILVGAVIAIIVEINGLTTGQWNYKESMPRIFGIGLSPLIQLFTTMLLSLGILKFFKWHKK